MIKSSADPWNLYVILHFFWLYLKEKKRSHRPFLVANWLFSLLPSCVCAILLIFFSGNSPYSLLSFLPSIFPISHSLYILWPAYYPPRPQSPQFWFLVYINDKYVCLYFARGWGQAISFKLLSCWVSCYPFKKDDIGLVVVSYQQKKRKTHFHSLSATCVLSCSKKS